MTRSATVNGARGVRTTRLAVVALAAGTALAPFGFEAASAAQRQRGREVVAQYSPVGVNVLVVDSGDPAISHASVDLAPLPRERTVSVSLRDDSGYVVRGSLVQGRETIASFCGETPEPVAIKPMTHVRVHVYTGTCGSSWGIATEGEITATFR